MFSVKYGQVWPLLFQEKLEPERGPSRLQLLLRSTPQKPAQEWNRTNLLSKFKQTERCLPVGKVGISGGGDLSQVCSRGSMRYVDQSQVLEGGGGEGLSQDQLCCEEGEQWGTKGMEAGILSASGFTHFSSLRQIPPCILAESAFPTPLPPPSWRARWKGDWWVVPAGMMTSSSSCLQWGPLTPA